MRNKLILVASILLFLPFTIRAQWSAGLLAGADYNIHYQDTHYMTDYRFRGAAGMNFGLSIQYTVDDWLSFRVDPSFLQKNYQHTRNVLTQMDYHYLNNYLLLPVLSSFHFGGFNLRGFVNAGVYGAYWLTSSRYGTDWSNMTNKEYAFARRRPQRRFPEPGAVHPGSHRADQESHLVLPDESALIRPDGFSK